MKVIDILDRIANGEKLHFCVINEDFKIEYFYEKGKPLRDEYDEDVEWRIGEDWLNCEVEIIEEDKKIKKIDYYDHLGVDLSQAVCNKINEIIDKLNEGE